MMNITFICDGCGREYKYDKIEANPRTHRPLSRIQPLRLIGTKEYCRACIKRIEKIMEEEIKFPVEGAAG